MSDLGKSFRFVRIFLYASLFLNVAALTYIIFQEREGVFWIEVEKPKEELQELLPSQDLQTCLKTFSSKTDEEIISSLDDFSLASQGYRVQEIAMAFLKKRGFQIDDPLRMKGSVHEPLSSISYTLDDGKEEKLCLFSSLSLSDIAEVKKYILDHELPFTAEGLVMRMKSFPNQKLVTSCLIRTDDWSYFEKVLGQGGIHLTEEELLDLSYNIGSDLFSFVVFSGKVGRTIDGQSLLLFLFSQKPSKELAEVVAKYARRAVLEKADDETVLLLLSNLQNDHVSKPSIILAQELLKVQRKPIIWKSCQEFLAKAMNAPLLISLSHDELIKRLSPQKTFQEKIQGKLQGKVKEIPSKNTPVTPPKKGEGVKKTIALSEDGKAYSTSKEKQENSRKPSQVAQEVKNRTATRQLKPFRSYVVKKGDTLWSIAKKFQVDVTKLKYLNKIKDSELTPGKTLVIPH